jgi:adenylate cyclase class IV
VEKMEELNTRIKKPDRLKEKLEKFGAEHEKTVEVRDKYFAGQGKDALKIMENEEGSFLRR